MSDKISKDIRNILDSAFSPTREQKIECINSIVRAIGFEEAVPIMLFDQYGVSDLECLSDDQLLAAFDIARSWISMKRKADEMRIVVPFGPQDREQWKRVKQSS